MEQSFHHDYNGFKASNGNIIWVAAMQLAWNQLREKFASNHPIKLHTEKPDALKIIQNFNKSHFKRSDISQKSIYVKSGYGQNTLDTINKETKQKFPQKTIPPLNLKLNDSDIISYAYLLKKVNFAINFKRREQPSFLFKNEKVESFYAKEKKQKQQVLVHKYNDIDNFTVQIHDKDGHDSIFLIKSEKHLTVDDALSLASKASEAKGIPLQKGDIFEMPVLKIDEERNYQELLGLQFSNAQLNKYYIRVMKEAVKLDVNESGAKVEAEAVIIATRSCAMRRQEDKIKQIILNKNFWIVMKEKNHHPYFCAYINKPGK